MWDPVIQNVLLGGKHQLDCNTETPLPTRGRIRCRNHWVWFCLCCSTPMSGAAECLSYCKEIHVGVCNKWFRLEGIKTILKSPQERKGEGRKYLRKVFLYAFAFSFCFLLQGAPSDCCTFSSYWCGICPSQEWSQSHPPPQQSPKR